MTLFLRITFSILLIGVTCFAIAKHSVNDNHSINHNRGNMELSQNRETSNGIDRTSGIRTAPAVAGSISNGSSTDAPRTRSRGTQTNETIVRERDKQPESRFGRPADLRVTATAYTYTGRRTASGRRPRVGHVAVDPRVIPLGTKLYLEGYGFCEAVDTGSAIKGRKVDVFLTTERACDKWGKRRNVKVWIINEKEWSN